MLKGRSRISFPVAVWLSVPGMAYLLVIAGRRVLPTDQVWADFLLQALLLPALPAPLATPAATAVLVRRWNRFGPVQRWVAVAACMLAWLGAMQLLTELMTMPNPFAA